MEQTELPATVLSANQADEIWDNYPWVDASIWTDRMLEALDKGVKGGRWYSLIDKIEKLYVLEKCFYKVSGNSNAAGVDHVTAEHFEQNLTARLAQILVQLKENRYYPQPIKRVWIDKPGSREKRPLGIPTVADRVVQTALVKLLEPIFEKEFAEQSYGFRPGRSCRQALRRVDELLREGKQWVADIDIKSYFDTIPHDRMMERVRQQVADGRVLELIRRYLKQRVMETLVGWEPDRGTPQGAVLSPLLSNTYLSPLDHKMREAGYEMVRYADDFVVLCETREEAEAALRKVKEWVKGAGLKLHPEKTRIVHESEGFDFLGYRFEKGKKYPRKKSLKKIRETIRSRTKRTNGNSLKEIIEGLNPVMRGWYGYYKHVAGRVMTVLDGYVRGRLRSILRKRRKLKGRARGADHHRWPNEFFHSLGLYSLEQARAETIQSLKG